MNQLLDEARRMPDASVRFARGVSQVRTPEHLTPLRTSVRKDHAAALRQLHEAVNQRFGTTGASTDYVNVFYAAAEMAFMAHVGRDTLPAGDRRTLRQLWEDLLNAS